MIIVRHAGDSRAFYHLIHDNPAAVLWASRHELHLLCKYLYSHACRLGIHGIIRHKFNVCCLKNVLPEIRKCDHTPAVQQCLNP